MSSDFCKNFDSLVSKILVDHVGSYIVFNQNEFFRGRSTSINICTYIEYIFSNKNHGWIVNFIYTEFSRAFDTGNISILLTKLEAFEIIGPLRNWFASYSTNRIQKVKLKSN